VVAASVEGAIDRTGKDGATRQRDPPEAAAAGGRQRRASLGTLTQYDRYFAGVVVLSGLNIVM
jgi:hypothetical protein